MTPATVCLAVPLYQQMELLKKNWAAVITAIASGVFSSLATVFIMSKLFGFTHEQYVTLLPKSITTAIGMGVSEKLEGIVTVTVVVIIITGILGNMTAELVFRIFGIEEPVAKGLSLGTASHAIGTAKAMELAMREGGVSPRQVDYINAHGTGTHHNDLFETRAIKLAFGEAAKGVVINSTKSMIGHLLGAAGGVEFIVCAKSIQDGFIHQTVGTKDIDPEECDLNYAAGAPVTKEVRCVLTNSLGFGGHNATLLLKKYEA